MTLDKKCLQCPVRKFAIESAQTLKMFYELNERILDVLEHFDTGYSQLNKVREESYKVIKNEYC